MKRTKEKDSKKKLIKLQKEISSKKKEMPLMLKRESSTLMNNNVL